MRRRASRQSRGKQKERRSGAPDSWQSYVLFRALGHRLDRVSQAVLNDADEAGQALDKAMEPSTPKAPSSTEAAPDDNVQRLVASYLQGRGARRDLRAATKAVKLALQAHQNTLLKWQRSSGDFKSAVECALSSVETAEQSNRSGAAADLLSESRKYLDLFRGGRPLVAPKDFRRTPVDVH